MIVMLIARDTSSYHTLAKEITLVVVIMQMVLVVMKALVVTVNDNDNKGGIGW